LVDEVPPTPAPEELLPPVEDDSEEIDDSAVETVSPDPRRVPPVADNMPGQQLWAFLAQYPEPQYLDLYLYRLFPVIKAIPPPEWTGNGKPPTYQEKVKGLITEHTNRIADYNWLRDVRGSGTYFVRIIDRRLKRTQNRQICTSKLEVNEWDTHPPVLNDWSELVPCEANKWIISRLLKDRAIKRNPEGGFMAYEASQNGNGPAPVASTDPGALLNQVVNLSEKLSKAMQPKESQSAFSGKDIVDLIKHQATQNDPQKVIDAAKGLVEISKPAEDKEGKTILAILLAQLEEQRKESAAAREREFKLMTDMLAKANTPPPAPPAPPDPEVQLTKTFDLLTKAKEFIGEGSASQMKGWQEFSQPIITGFMDLLKPLAQVGATVLQAKAMINLQQQNANTKPATPPASAPPSTPATVQQAQQPQPPGTQPAPNAPATPAESAPPIDPNIQGIIVVINAVLHQVDLTLRDHFEHAVNKDEGYSGEDFAGWFCDVKIALPPPYNLMAPNGITGAEALSRIRSFSANDPQGNFVPAPEAGKQIILASYRQNPQVWQALCPTEERAAQFETFVQEFLSYDPEAEPEVLPPPPVKGANAHVKR